MTISAMVRVERGRATVRGRSAVIGGRLLSREAVQRSRDAQDGGDEAERGMTWADVVEVHGSGRRSLVRGERRWGAVSGGGGRQLTARGGRTQRRGARGVVNVVREGLERRSMEAQRWWVWQGVGAVKWQRRKKRLLHGGGWLPL
jgi:hypothetical protein